MKPMQVKEQAKMSGETNYDPNRLARIGGVANQAMSASGCLGTNDDELLEEIRRDEHTWNGLLRMVLKASAPPVCLGMGTHLIAVARKSG
jgi:hypothetical protein